MPDPGGQPHLPLPTEPGFRFNAKNAFLTYPQCWADPDDFLAALLAKGPYVVTSHTISQELHEDGSPHFHVLLTFDAKFSTRSPSAFDVELDGNTYHPNIASPRCVSLFHFYNAPPIYLYLLSWVNP